MSDIKISIGADIKELQTKLAQAGGVTTDFANKAQVASAKVGSSFTSLASKSQVAQTAISQVGQSIGGLAAMGSTLLTGGLLVAIPLIISGLQALGDELLGVSSAQKALNETIEGSAKAMGDAIAQVSELTSKVDLAKKGFLSKDEVVKEYNKTLGKTTGEVKSIEEAEQMLINKGPAYIKSMALKAAANFAFAKSGELLAQALLLMSQRATGITGQAFDDITKKMEKNAKEFLNIAKAAQESAILLDYENGFVRTVKEPKPVKVKEVKIKPAKVTVDLQDAEIKSAGIGGTSGAKGDLADEFSKKMEDAVAQGGGLRVTFKPVIYIEKPLAGEMTKQLSEFQDLVSSIVQEMATETLSTVGEAIGAVLAGDSGAIPNLFGGLITSIGSQIQQLGKFLIRSGIEMKVAKDAFKKLLANPILAVAAGIGLVALGALLKSQAQKQYKGFASGVRSLSEGGIYEVGERGRERIFLPQGASVQPTNELQAYGGGGMAIIPELRLGYDAMYIAFQRGEKIVNRNG